MDSMLEILCDLPLFRGVTTRRMEETVGKVKFHFLKYAQNEVIVNAGDPCTHIKFIISGQARSTITNADDRFRVSQTLSAPDVIAPDFLFGTATQYPCTVTSLTPVSIVQIAKADYLNILNSDPVFIFNYLNLLSMNAQKSVEGVLAITTGSLEERVAFWIVALTQPSGSDIVLSCRQRDLYSVFGVQRSSFIASLDSLKNRGIIDYNSNEIRVLDRRALLSLLRSPVEI